MASGQGFWLRNTCYYLKYSGVFSLGKFETYCNLLYLLTEGKFRHSHWCYNLFSCTHARWESLFSQSSTEFQHFYSTSAVLTTDSGGQFLRRRYAEFVNKAILIKELPSVHMTEVETLRYRLQDLRVIID